MVILPVAGVVRAGRVGADRSVGPLPAGQEGIGRGQSGLMTRVCWRAWRASLAGEAPGLVAECVRGGVSWARVVAVANSSPRRPMDLAVQT